MQRLFQYSYPLFLYFCLGIILILSTIRPVYATDIFVITNATSPLETLSRSEIRQVFLGGTLSRKYEPISLIAGNQTRALFNTKVLGLTEGRIQAYWAQLLFSGKSEKPPKEFEQESEVIDYVSSHDKVIGYVSSHYSPVPNNIKIIYQK